MKAKIISKIIYMAETEDGNLYDVDIKNPLVKSAYDNNFEIDGVIHKEHTYSDKSFKTNEKFIPLKEKIIVDEIVEKVKPIENISKKIKSSKHIGLPKK